MVSHPPYDLDDGRDNNQINEFNQRTALRFDKHNKIIH